MAMIKVPQVARYLGVSRETAYRYVREGLIPGYRYRGRVVVDQRDLERFMAEHRIGNGSAPASNGDGPGSPRGDDHDDGPRWYDRHNQVPQPLPRHPREVEGGAKLSDAILRRANSPAGRRSFAEDLKDVGSTEQSAKRRQRELVEKPWLTQGRTKRRDDTGVEHGGIPPR